MRTRTGLFTLVALGATAALFLLSNKKAHEVDRVKPPTKVSRSLRPLLSPENSQSTDHPRVAKMRRYQTLKCGSKNTADCEFATQMLRSTQAASIRVVRPVSDITDLPELADLLVASFGEFMTDLSPRGLREMTEIADRMLELDPTLFPAAKASAMAWMLRDVFSKEAIQKGETPAEMPNWDELEKRVRRIEEMDPLDPDLDALNRIVETEGMEPERVRRDSLARLARDPENWREYQILAWANWKANRHEDAKAEIIQALKLKPNEPELLANWKAINRPGAKLDDFKISFKVGVAFSDLLK